MGVTYSSEGDTIETDKTNAQLKDRRQCLRFSQEAAHSLVLAAIEHRVPILIDLFGFRGLISVSMAPDRNKDSVEPFISIIWELFEEDGVINTLELLMVIVLLAKAPWANRIGMIFDIFKNAGTAVMMHDDVILAGRTAFTALRRLWRVPSEEQPYPDEINGLVDKLSTALFLRLEKDLLQPVKRDDFINWAFERFKEKKTIASVESLKSIYESPF